HEAHNLYLQGLYFWNRRLEGGMQKAMEHFHRAIEKDPGYALAHVGVADTYNISGMFSYLPPNEMFPKAKEAARKALEIDATLGEANASLAFTNTFFDWDWAAAEKEFKRAIELNPNYAIAHEWYALYLMAMDRFDESIEEAERALELDPLSFMINCVVGIAYHFAHRYDEAIAHHRKTLEMDPYFLPASAYISVPLVECGMYDDSIEVMERVESLAAGNAYTLGYFGLAYGMTGRKEKALEILDRLDELAQERYVSPIHYANILYGLGDIDKTFEYLEKAYAERNPMLVLFKATPWIDPMRSDPRFISLLKKIGF
ncbi:MAG: hypothetical protein JSV33_02045, partial [bacterium]